MATPDLDQQLRDLGAQLAFPSTPALAPAVRARIRRERARLRWRFALATAAAVLLALAATLALVPDARRAVAGFLGLPGFQVQKVRVLPSPPLVRGAKPVTVDEARRLAGFTLLIPGPPERVRAAAFDGTPPGGEVELDLAAGAVITEVTGTVDAGFFGKMIGPNGQVTEVDVGGSKGYWFSGDLHAFFYMDGSGQFRTDILRLSRDTLVFERKGVLVRIEGARDQPDALRIAALIK